MAKKILVTGSNGLLGQNILKRFNSTSLESCAAISRLADKFGCGGNISFNMVDITDWVAVDYIIGLEKPDCIIHTAAMSKPNDCENDNVTCWDTNVNGTKHIVDAANKVGATVVLISSDFVFDGTKPCYGEEVRTSPLSAYGRSKAVAEETVRRYAEKWAIVRTSMVYGVSKTDTINNFATWVVDSLRKGKSIKVVDDQYRTPTYVGDLAKACLTIAERDLQGIYNVAGPELQSVYEIAKRIAYTFGLDDRLIFPVNTSILHEPAMRPPRTYLSCDKAMDDFYYMPADLLEGLERFRDELAEVEEMDYSYS